MATYKANQRGYIGRIIEQGEVFQFDGKPGKWMDKVETATPAEKEDGKSADKKTDGKPGK
jgi:hypothetical protein